jgi:hypothetical protein
LTRWRGISERLRLAALGSGIPPFRGPGRLWGKYDPRTLELDYFLSHPDKAWPAIREIFYCSFGKAKPYAALLRGAVDSPGVLPHWQRLSDQAFGPCSSFYLNGDEISAVPDWQRALKRLVDAGELRNVLTCTTGSRPGRAGSPGPSFTSPRFSSNVLDIGQEQRLRSGVVCQLYPTSSTFVIVPFTSFSSPMQLRGDCGIHR